MKYPDTTYRMIMDHLRILSLMIGASLSLGIGFGQSKSTATAAGSHTTVIGYYPKETNRIKNAKLDYEAVDIAIIAAGNWMATYPYASMIGNGSRDSLNSIHGNEPGSYCLKSVKDSTRAHGKKVIYGLAFTMYGGYNPIPLAMGDTNVIWTAARQLASYCRRQGYDGVDMNWEWPGGGMTADQLTRWLRIHMSALRDTLGSGAILTITAPAQLPQSRNSVWANGAQNSNWVSYVMEEVYLQSLGQANAYWGYSAALYPHRVADALNTTGRYDAGNVWDPNSTGNWFGFYALKQYGYTKAVSCLGYAGTTQYRNFSGIGNAPSGASAVGPDGSASNLIDRLYDTYGSYPRQWDNVSKVPFLDFSTGGTRYFVSYEDSLSLAYKTQFAVDSGYGAIMVWSVNDVTVLSGNFNANSAPGHGDRNWYLHAIRNSNTGSVPPVGPPSVPSLVLPANGAANQPLTPSLTWNASSGASSYRLQVSTTSNFSTMLVNDSTVTATTRQVGPLQASTTYFWRVNAKNSSGTSPFSSLFSFTTAQPDGQAPTVQITAPANSAVVSGTTPVTASASDNIGVAGVQFRLDGVNLGPEVTASPFTTSWNTTLAVNGSHSLTAVARDAAGNTATATPVTVAVTNTAPPAGDLPIYVDTLQAPWHDASWTATNSFNSTEQKYNGAYSIKSVDGAWGGFQLSRPTTITNVTSFTTLEFAIFSPVEGLTINVFVKNETNTFPTIVDTPLPANRWVVRTFRMSDLNPASLPIDYVAIQNYSGSSKTFYIDNLHFNSDPASVTDPPAPAPTTFDLGQNYPNPFNPETTIPFTVPSERFVSIKIFTILGEEVSTLVNEIKHPGNYIVRWNAGDRPSGVYLCRMSGGRTPQIRKLILMR
jgi:hypothetical protein